MLRGRHILLGIGGGIAVYRVAELARMLMRQGAHVRCIMTRAACEFVTPLTFEALTGEAVHTELFDLTDEREMGHIRLARWADVLVIAPATANQLAKYANGIADDLLGTVVQVCESPVLLAPAMNVSMWRSAATRRNVATLKERGFRIIGPEAGDLACGERGEGRLVEPQALLSAIGRELAPQRLQGQRWVINAGPTWEAWDAVRILSNRASGRLGAALAVEAWMQGAEVCLVAGPGTPAVDAAIRRVDVESAADMLKACEDAAAGADVFVATAAVSDYRIDRPHAGKLKRGDREELELKLVQNPDIVATIAAMKHRPATVIAFAAECEDLRGHARKKLERKGVDAIVANPVANMGRAEAGGIWMDHDGAIEIESADKAEMARKLIDIVLEKQR